MSKKSRKPYKKPQINQVKLVIEEAVLGGCKAKAGDAGPGQHCTFKNCEFAGS
jgi:hypothetical protein